VSTFNDDKNIRKQNLDSFFNSIASQMSLMMRHLIQCSINGMVNFFKVYKSSSCSIIIPFQIDLTVSNHKGSLTMNLEPSFNEITLIINDIIERIVNSLSHIPRVKNFLL
jgi:hypothetical protein